MYSSGMFIFWGDDILRWCFLKIQNSNRTILISISLNQSSRLRGHNFHTSNWRGKNIFDFRCCIIILCITLVNQLLQYYWEGQSVFISIFSSALSKRMQYILVKVFVHQFLSYPLPHFLRYCKYPDNLANELLTHLIVLYNTWFAKFKSFKIL